MSALPSKLLALFSDQISGGMCSLVVKWTTSSARAVEVLNRCTGFLVRPK